MKELCHRLVALWVVVSSCNHNPVIKPPHPVLVGVDVCAGDVAITSREICNGLFTDDMFQCARCPLHSACVDVSTYIYCIDGDRCGIDRACHAELPAKQASRK